VPTRMSPGETIHSDALMKVNESEQGGKKDELVRTGDIKGRHNVRYVEAKQGNQLFDARQVERLTSARERIRKALARAGACATE
jgi:hypothetical protein